MKPCPICTHLSHGDCAEVFMAVADAARNVVAQWRGDISRKPHIGRLREALAALDAACADDPDSTSALPKEK